MKPLFRIVLATMLTLGVGTLAAPSAFAWSPMTVTTDCSTNGQTLVWTVQASNSESNLDIQFADNEQFNNYSTHTLNSTTLSVQVTTPVSVAKVWVRWAADTSVVYTGLAPQDCQPTDVVNPKGSIGGPCYDPSYYGVFDNSASTSVSIQFRFRWYTTKGLQSKSKLVPAGAVYTTWIHWVKPGTLVRVGYKNPTTGMWTNLASLRAAHGRYPPCQYTPGWSYPTL